MCITVENKTAVFDIAFCPNIGLSWKWGLLTSVKPQKIKACTYFFQYYHLSPLVTWFIKLRAACETCVSKAVQCQTLFHFCATIKSCSLDVLNPINNTTQLLTYVEMFLRNLVTEYHINETKMVFVSHHSIQKVSVEKKPVLCCWFAFGGM